MTFHGYRGPHRQRGVIGLLGALVMMLVVVCIALALDTGRLYMEQRNLQRVADLAALEAANQADDGIDETTDAQLTAFAATSSRLNRHDVDETGRDIQALGGGLCHIEGVRRFEALPFGASGVCADGRRVLRNVVQVKARHRIPGSLVGQLMGQQQVLLEAEASARRRPQQPLVSFSLGSRLLDVDDDDGLLHVLLGDSIAASLAGYDGLLNAQATLADLLSLGAVAGTAGGGLVDNATLDLQELLSADLSAITRGDELDTQLGFFDEVLTILINENGLDSVELGEVLSLSTQAPEDALNASVRLADLLTAFIFLGQEDRAIAIDELGLSLPAGLGGLALTLEVVEPPNIVVGPVGCLDGGLSPCPQGSWITEARTAQLDLVVSGTVEVPLIAHLDLTLSVLGAGARSGIEEIQPLDEEGGYRLYPAAYGNPIGVALDLGVDVLNTDIDDIDSDGLTTGIVAGLGLEVEGTLLGGLLGVVDDVLDGLFGWLTPDDDLQDEVQPDGEQTERLDESWVGVALEQEERDFVEWPSDNPEAHFSGDAMVLTSGLSEALDGVDVKVNLLGGGGDLLEPVAELLKGVISGVVVDTLAVSVIDPILQVLGVRMNDADMVILDVEPSVGGSELVL